MIRAALIFAACMAITGCYNVITINIGGVQKQAAGAGIPPPPEVQCAALTSNGAHLDGIDLEAVKPCEATTAAKIRAKSKSEGVTKP